MGEIKKMRGRGDDNGRLAMDPVPAKRLWVWTDKGGKKTMDDY